MYNPPYQDYYYPYLSRESFYMSGYPAESRPTRPPPTTTTPTTTTPPTTTPIPRPPSTPPPSHWHTPFMMYKRSVKSRSWLWNPSCKGSCNTFDMSGHIVRCDWWIKQINGTILGRHVWTLSVIWLMLLTRFAPWLNCIVARHRLLFCTVYLGRFTNFIHHITKQSF